MIGRKQSETDTCRLQKKSFRWLRVLDEVKFLYVCVHIHSMWMKIVIDKIDEDFKNSRKKTRKRPTERNAMQCRVQIHCECLYQQLILNRNHESNSASVWIMYSRTNCVSLALYLNCVYHCQQNVKKCTLSDDFH